MTPHCVRKTCTILFVIMFGSAVAWAQNGASPAAEEANALFQAGKWPQAAQAYDQLTKADPKNGQAWARLAKSLHAQGKYKEAIEAGLRAVAISNRPIVMYNLGASYARSNNNEKAFEWITKAITAGFPVQMFKADEDLASLRIDTRFEQLLVLGEKISKPCMFSSEARQFDFWVGEWDVQINGQTVGTNSIQRLDEGCIIMENWTGLNGNQTGKSINFFNPITKKWRQTYVGSRAAVWEMEGEYRDSAMRYEGTVFSAQGKALTRVTFFNLGPDKVRHLQEDSTDNGKTWNAVWDAIYVRKK